MHTLRSVQNSTLEFEPRLGDLHYVLRGMCVLRGRTCRNEIGARVDARFGGGSSTHGSEHPQGHRSPMVNA
eukprot:2612476-Alexandrium_andersonii.AAC.1